MRLIVSRNHYVKLSFTFPPRSAASMSLYLPISFLVFQFVILVFVPSVADPAAYIYMVIAPLLAAAAASWRGRSESTAARFGWYAVALALVVWAAGAFGNLWQELIFNRRNEMYRA